MPWALLAFRAVPPSKHPLAHVALYNILTLSSLAGSNTHGSHSHSHGSELGSTTSATDSTTHKKPSLMDKLNPKVDANGDGKAGFMK